MQPSSTVVSTFTKSKLILFLLSIMKTIKGTVVRRKATGKWCGLGILLIGTALWLHSFQKNQARTLKTSPYAALVEAKPSFNCTPVLPDLPPPDVPFSKTALSNIDEMRRRIENEQRNIAPYFQQQDKLETLIRDNFQRKPVALVLGGNNGWFADPLFPLLMAHEWPAIIVEALPHQYASLVSNYGKKHDGCLWHGLHLINKAVVEEKKYVTMSYMVTNRWQRGGGSVLNHHKEKGWKTMSVPGDTLAGILTNTPHKDIDLIQIDVEGLDETLLKQVDQIMDTIHPRLVCLETCKEYCHSFFAKHGFKEVKSTGQVCGEREI